MPPQIYVVFSKPCFDRTLFLYAIADSGQSVNVGNVASVCFTTLKNKTRKINEYIPLKTIYFLVLFLEFRIL